MIYVIFFLLVVNLILLYAVYAQFNEINELRARVYGAEEWMYPITIEEADYE